MKKLIIHIVILVVLIGGAAWLLSQRHANEGADMSVTPTAGVTSTSDLVQTYTDSDLNFSFKYPNAFTANASDGASSRLILVSLPEQNREFQVYVTPFGDAPETVAADRIRQDIPGIDMREPETISIPNVGPGLTFLSSRSGISGDVREVWFAVGGHLYQWSAPVGSQSALDSAIASLSISGMSAQK